MDMDAFVTRVINEAKINTSLVREAILNGNLSHEEYLKQSAWLHGVDVTLELLIEQAKRFYKESIDGE